MAPLHKPSLGTVRAYYLSLVVMVAGFMAGYDSGVAGGILTFPSFETDYGYAKHAATESKKVNSFTVGFQQLGSFVACFFAYPMTAKYGRKLSIQISAFVFMVGVIIETVNTRSLAAWYVGRVIAGFGQGALCVVVPIFSAEMAPKEIRGRLGSLYQWNYTLGIFFSYWVDYVSMLCSPTTCLTASYQSARQLSWQARPFSWRPLT